MKRSTVEELKPQIEIPQRFIASTL